MKNKIMIIILVLLIIDGIYFINNKTDIKGIYVKVSKDYVTKDVDYLKDYKSNIVNKSPDKLVYTIGPVSNKHDSILYIDNDYLYIKDVYFDTKYKVFDCKVKYLYSEIFKEKEYYTYVITDKNELFKVMLPNIDIGDFYVTKVDLKNKVLNFTNIKMKFKELDLAYPSNYIIVLCDDNKFHETTTDLVYLKGDELINDKYIIHSDRTVSTINNKLLVDSNNNPYKVKVAVNMVTEKVFGYNPDEMFITDKNKLIFLVSDETIFEYKYKVKGTRANFWPRNSILFINGMIVDLPGLYSQRFIEYAD